MDSTKRNLKDMCEKTLDWMRICPNCASMIRKEWNQKQLAPNIIAREKEDREKYCNCS